MKKRRAWKRVLAFMLTFAMIFSVNGLYSFASAAEKAPKLSTSNVTVKAGASKKVTLKNKPAKAKVTWTSKNKKIATVKSGTITGVKKGNTKVVCKVVYKKKAKNVTKKLVVKVKVTEVQKPSPTLTPTAKPTTAPSASPEEFSEKSNLGEEHISANGIKTKDNGQMRENMTNENLMSVMGLGWNLGNQLETSNWKETETTVSGCETSAGNAVATQTTFDGLKSYGINTVRVPVAWSNLMAKDGTYTLNEDLMNRVEEVINYALNDEMYVIINIHWDGGWWGMFGDADQSVRDEAWKKYEAIWTQLANRYKEYSDRLIFEGANEELGARLNDDWKDPNKGETGATGVLTPSETYEVSAQINQKFVDIVRASGGNNKYRFLLIPGQGTILNDTCSDKFIMPADSEENGNKKLSVSVHYYEPTDFGIARTSTNSWGYRDSWGTDKDYTYMTTQMDKLKMFTDKGYGVIIGECGCAVTNKDGIPAYLTELFKQCMEKGYCPVMWDEGSYYSRKDGYFVYDDVGEVFAKATNSTPKIPEGASFSKTGIPSLDAIVSAKAIYAWEGEFMRHVGADDGERLAAERPDDFDVLNQGIGKTTKITDADGKETDALETTINPEYWNITFKADWSTFEEPCIRITMADNKQSQSAQLQLGYMESGNSQIKFEKDYDQVDVNGNISEKTAWIEKYVPLDKDALALYPYVWITTNTYTGASFVKVEFCDAAK